MVEISAILLARSIALFDVADLNPRGKVFFPHIVPLLNERFMFQVFPSKPEDLDLSKGIVFENGYFEGRSVGNLTLYNDGIRIDVQTSTDDGQLIMTDTLRWLAAQDRIAFVDELIQRWSFVSHITFHSDIDLDVLHPALRKLGREVSVLINAQTGMDLGFCTDSISLNFDRVNVEIPLSRFGIERRAKSLKSENKYFSVAPLQTDLHIGLLKQFESDVRDST